MSRNYKSEAERLRENYNPEILGPRRSSNLNAGDTIVPEIVRENSGKDIINSEIENLNEGELDLIIGGNLEEENNIEITPDHTKTLNSEEHLDEGVLDSNIEANLEENLNPEEIKKESKMSKSDDELKQLAKAYSKAIKANNNDQQDEIYSELNEEAKRFWKILEPLIDKDEKLKTLRDKISIEQNRRVLINWRLKNLEQVIN